MTGAVLARVADWATGEDLSLSYDSAYTWLPGRVEIENLTLRTSDSNVQVERTAWCLTRTET